MMRRKAFIAVFLFLVAAPLVAFVFGYEMKSTDRRSLASRPALSIEGLEDRSFFSLYEGYFNDHFPVRAALIKAKAIIDFRVLGVSPAPSLHIGKDGWLYLKKDLVDFMKNSCADKEAMTRLAQDLRALEDVVEASGRRFLFFVAPNKMTIYPEYAGVEPFPTCGKSRLDLLKEAFREFPLRNQIMADELLLDAKKSRQVYKKNDSHWSYNGSKLVSDETLKRIAPGLVLFPPRIVDGVVVYTGGDLSDMTMTRLTETLQELKIDGYPYGTRVEKMPPLKYAGWVPLKITVEDAPPEAVLVPRAIFFADSFMYLPLKFMQGAFERIDVVWSKTIPVPERAEELKAARIVVVEAVERDLGELKIDVEAVKEMLSSPQ
ncbi:MAG: hypothetical protein A2X99_01540 [Deltaproteobacteria bacterium GWB2_55_19]|nr:MAG: hypothetical protein A2X99_01540 [Deltaproteobacteria bacterium GWB2_55_19]HAO93750.1 hypothetical protein [Deltaproteobacteria bacterium]